MKFYKTSIAIMLCCGLCLSSCGISNAGKGALIGGGGGGAIGAGIGAVIGGKDNRGKGAAIGAGVGTAVGAGIGALIGRKMDKQQEMLKQELENAKVEQTQDKNGLQAIRVTFDGGILFPTNKWSINKSAQAELKAFAASLTQNPLTDVTIYGYTDNTGSLEVNQKVSTNRADAVKTFMTQNGIASGRITAEGLPMQDYVADNNTNEGRALNRRVEIYIYASDRMIQEAEAGTLK